MFFSSVSKYIIELYKNNTCIYNYTGVYYFLSEGENACRDRKYHGAFTII